MLTLYGIKNCDTVKKARRWLSQQELDYRFHDFREDGLTESLLQHFMTQTAWQTLLNQRSTSWRQLEPEQQSDLTEQKAFQLMLAYPTLIKRPVLDTGHRMLVGFSADIYQTELLLYD